jgi:hypothetical protein
MEEKINRKIIKKRNGHQNKNSNLRKLFNEGYSLKEMISKFSKHNQKDI